MSDQYADAVTATGGVIGVLGATGGLGVSTLATTLAMRSAVALGASLLVDGHPRGGGLDVHVGLDGEQGLRWADLAAVRGEMESAAVLSGLPSAQGCRVLSWDRRPGVQLNRDGVGLARSLAEESIVTIVDLPGPEAHEAHEWWRLCQHVVLLCGGGVQQVAAAAIALECLNAVLEPASPSGAPRRSRDMGASVVGVIRQQRSGRADRDVLSAMLGLPFVGAMRDDPKVVTALIRGEPVGVKNSPVALLADSILADTLPSRRTAA